MTDRQMDKKIKGQMELQMVRWINIDSWMDEKIDIDGFMDI